MRWKENTNNEKVRFLEIEHMKEAKIAKNDFSMERASKIIAPCE